MAYTGDIMMGLQKAEFGTIEADGDVATTWETLGYTNPDSCTIETDDPEETEINAEEVDDPIYIARKAGTTTISLEVQNPTIDAVVSVCGGTKGENDEWNAPSTVPDIEKSIKLTLTTGQIFTFPRVSINAKISGTIGKSDNIKLSITGKVLVPTKTGVAKMILTPKA